MKPETEIGMSVTYNLRFIGEKTIKSSAFLGREVEIYNTYKVLDNETYKKLEIFHTKKLALEFCEKWGFSKNLVRRVESRFQKGWAIGLGRNLYAPDLAEAMLLAKEIGCVIETVIDERKYLNQEPKNIFDLNN
ncbi:hypothetical protein V8P84_07115 [Acinetobacter baumannii]